MNLANGNRIRSEPARHATQYDHWTGCVVFDRMVDPVGRTMKTAGLEFNRVVKCGESTGFRDLKEMQDKVEYGRRRPCD